MADENKIIENNEEIVSDETMHIEDSTKEVETKEELKNEKSQKKTKNKKEKPIKEKKKKSFKNMVCLYGSLISIIILIVSGFLFYSKYFERNEFGIKDKTYVNINESGIKTSIKIKGDTLTFIEFDFKESYETMALMNLAKNMGVEFNKLNQA